MLQLVNSNIKTKKFLNISRDGLCADFVCKLFGKSCTNQLLGYGTGEPNLQLPIWSILTKKAPKATRSPFLFETEA